MKHKIKLFFAVLGLTIAVAACTPKPAENSTTDGQDSVATDTTTQVTEPDSVSQEVPADSAAGQ